MIYNLYSIGRRNGYWNLIYLNVMFWRSPELKFTKWNIANYQFHNTSLTELNSCKYLGVTIQSDLKWSQHIHQITVKANCTLSLIKRNLRLASKSLRETAYFTLVQSQLEYASTIWSPWLCKDKLELEKVQRRAARFVCNNYDPMHSVTAMIDELNWQILENHRNNSRLCLLFKIMWQQIHVPTDRGVARLTLMVGHIFYHTAHLLLLLSNGMLVHTCIYLWMF